MTAAFLTALELWCTDVERVSTGVHLDTLPAEVRRKLKHLEAPRRMLRRV